MEKQNVIYPPEFFCEGMEAMFVNGKKKIRVHITGTNPITAIDKEGIELMHYAETLTPILPKLSFTPDMLKALLAGNKTQTTRKAVTKSGKPATRKKIGDVIGVGQRWGRDMQYNAITEEACKANNIAFETIKWQPQGCTLPPEAILHLLRITNVELKRPCDFTDEEIEREGIMYNGDYGNDHFFFEDGGRGYNYAIDAWKALLQSIHKKPSDFEAFWNNEQIMYTFELIR